MRDWEVAEPGAGPAVNTLSTAFAAISQLVPGTVRSCKVYPDRYATQTGFSLGCGPMMVQVFMVKEEDGTQRAFVHTALSSQVEENSAGPPEPLPT